jgi:hypothetical protein
MKDPMKIPAILSLTFFLLFINSAVSAQTFLFKGIIRDEQTLKPIPGVNIRVTGTAAGAATDKDGRFFIKLEKTPSSLEFTCIGYKDGQYEVTRVPGNQLEFLLSPKSYNLKEVNITANNYSYLFKNRDYSVLDYELMDEHILLLVFRTLLNRSQLILLNRYGDTLSVTELPELPPRLIYKDFLANIHYCSQQGNAYQCYFNKDTKTIDFLFKTTLDSLRTLFRPFIFSMNEHVYFQEKIFKGFGTTFGYIEPGTGKKYIRQVINRKKVTEFSDDQTFYARWNHDTGGNTASDTDDIESERAFDFSSSDIEGGRYGKFEARAHAFEYFNMTYPVIKTKDNTIAFFNFGSDVIELMDKDGKQIKTVPISFHKESSSALDSSFAIRLSDSGWRWGSTILVDELNRNIYTAFIKAGMVRLNRIDLGTGKLKTGTILPFPFPEKIEIYDGEAFFINQGVNENRKLVKCKL